MAQTTKPTINTYVSDMLALEKHLAQPLEHQDKDDAVKKYTYAARVISESFAVTMSHIASLERRLQALGGHDGAGIKNGVASALGAAAALIGDSRKTEVSKYLRDDYSALSLASASYTMLHATALALGDAETAALAKSHLTDTANLIMRISATLPVTVLEELFEEGVAADPSYASEAQANVEAAWKAGSARSQN